jgi:hypothetical protein
MHHTGGKPAPDKNLVPFYRRASQAFTLQRTRAV